jgi:uncharacterized protein involved in exopolysaccharide biosynthesis
MATKKNKKKPATKRKAKRKIQKRGFWGLLRQWSLPFVLLLIISVSLAATFYLVFLHIPSTPFF